MHCHMETILEVPKKTSEVQETAKVAPAAPVLPEVQRSPRSFAKNKSDPGVARKRAKGHQKMAEKIRNYLATDRITPNKRVS